MKILKHFSGFFQEKCFLYQEFTPEDVEVASEERAIASIINSMTVIKGRLLSDKLSEDQKVEKVKNALPILDKLIEVQLPGFIEKNLEKSSEIELIISILLEEKILFLDIRFQGIALLRNENILLSKEKLFDKESILTVSEKNLLKGKIIFEHILLENLKVDSSNFYPEGIQFMNNENGRSYFISSEGKIGIDTNDGNTKKIILSDIFIQENPQFDYIFDDEDIADKVVLDEKKEKIISKKDKVDKTIITETEDKVISGIDNYQMNDFLKNKHLMMLLYYSDSFISKTLVNLKDENTKKMLKIKSEIGALSNARNIFIKKLSNKYDYSKYDFKITKKPLSIINSPEGENHTDAIDLFIKEGNPVNSMTAGIVLINESGWNSSDKNSSVSNKGGNFVLIFNPETEEFFRYCHLQSTQELKPGDIVSAGQNIGKVGHTGKNATRPGHGNHLHIEINKFDGKKMIPQQRKYLMNRINNAI